MIFMKGDRFTRDDLKMRFKWMTEEVENRFDNYIDNAIAGGTLEDVGNGVIEVAGDGWTLTFHHGKK